MNYDTIKNKIYNINNITEESKSIISNLKIKEYQEYKKLDIKKLLSSKKIITLSSEFQTPVIVSNSDKLGTTLYYTTYNIILIQCPLYLIPYIKMSTISTKSDTSSFYDIRIQNIEDNEEIVTEDNKINSIRKDIKIMCSVLTSIEMGQRIKFVITIFNPREFK